MSRIAEFREKAKLTQEELAARVGVERSTVSKWETGAAFPNRKILPEVARAVGCGIGDLFEDGQENAAG